MFCTFHVLVARFAGLKRNLENSTSEYVLVKDLTIRPPDQQMKDHIPSGFKHVFLIRHPTLVYHSYRKAKYAELLANNALPDGVDESTYDIEKHDVTRKASHFFEYLHALWGHVRENIDPNPIVINSQNLLDNPKIILTQFCELTGLPYHDSLLRWDASTDVIKNWKAVGDNLVYHAVSFFQKSISSTEFLRSKEPIPHDQLTEDVIRLADSFATLL